MAGLLPFTVGTQGLSKPVPLQPEENVLRIAHLTDVHMQPEKGAPEGLSQCLQVIQSFKPSLLVNGGDTIMDALNQDTQRVKEQWDTWNSIANSEVSIPLVHCIGNHDVWGWEGAKKDALYGKQWALEEMGLKNRYYSLIRGNWKIIVLDSTHIKDDGSWYVGKLGEEQLTWLRNELAGVPAQIHVLVVSHIPILSAAVFFDSIEYTEGHFQVPGAWVHSDMKEITKVLEESGKVKLCISGHLHLYDKVEYNNITYICNGAVSGNWWQGKMYHQTEAGFGLIDLHPDGSFSNSYHTY